ncbi:hypothetical protein CPB86DRAFT_788441 [Serendipita vermifera]|nr:hypothetical protein CPB86DRAFT_788441 [Serendipita vermifera]
MCFARLFTRLRAVVATVASLAKKITGNRASVVVVAHATPSNTSTEQEPAEVAAPAPDPVVIKVVTVEDERLDDLSMLSAVTVVVSRFSTVKEPLAAEGATNKNLTVQQRVDQHQKRLDRVLSSLEQRSRRVSTDPLAILPIEISLEIIYLTLSVDQGQLFNHAYDVRRCRDLLLVSKRWRMILLSRPSLWSTIIIDTSKTRYPDFVRGTLRNSGQAPLDVIIHLPITGFRVWRGVRRDLKRHADRIQTISFRPSPTYRDQDSWRVTEWISGTLQGLTPLPNLVNIEWAPRFQHAATDPQLKWLSQEFGRMKLLSGIKLRREALENKPFPDLRQVQTAIGIDTFVPLQAGMAMLTDVTLWATAPPDLNAINGTGSRADKGPILWKNLFCYQEDAVRLPSFASRLINLVTLELAVDGRSIGSILLNLHHLTQLECLTIGTYDLPQSTVKPLPKVKEIQSNGSVKYLELTNKTYPDPLPSGAADYMSQLHDALAKALPAIEELQLSMPFWALSASRLFEGSVLPRLRDVQVSITTEDSSTRRFELGPSARNVRISCFDDVWTGFSSKSADRLYVRVEPKPASYVKGGRASKFRPEEWSSLRSLSVPPSYLPKWGDEFRQLKDLSLTRGPDSNDWFGDAVTRFCWQLARNPASLPSLDSLTLHGIPQWDIYFLMLKRRNAAASKTVSPLRILGLQERFPKQLYDPIMNFVRGNQVTSESNLLQMVSIHQAFPTLRDPLVLGCISCLLCFRPCNAKLEADKYALPVFSHAYPTTEDKLLSDWEDLNQYYQKVLSSGAIRRSGQCKDSPIIYHS